MPKLAAEQLASEIRSAFGNYQLPSGNVVAPHECEECAEIRQVFSGYENGSIPNQVIDLHFDSLPLLSPEAFRCFFPAYLLRSLETHWKSDVGEFTLYAMVKNKKAEEHSRRHFEHFGPQQLKTLLRCLDFIAEQLDSHLVADTIVEAKTFISELLNEKESRR